MSNGAMGPAGGNGKETGAGGTRFAPIGNPGRTLEFGEQEYQAAIEEARRTFGTLHGEPATYPDWIEGRSGCLSFVRIQQIILQELKLADLPEPERAHLEVGCRWCRERLATSSDSLWHPELPLRLRFRTEMFEEPIQGHIHRHLKEDRCKSCLGENARAKRVSIPGVPAIRCGQSVMHQWSARVPPDLLVILRTYPKRNLVKATVRTDNACYVGKVIGLSLANRNNQQHAEALLAMRANRACKAIGKADLGDLSLVFRSGRYDLRVSLLEVDPEGIRSRDWPAIHAARAEAVRNHAVAAVAVWDQWIDLARSASGSDDARPSVEGPGHESGGAPQESGSVAGRGSGP